MERFEGISRLSVAEKAQLAEELWQQLADDQVPPEHLRVLEERELKYGDSFEGVPLDEAMKQLRGSDSASTE